MFGCAAWFETDDHIFVHASYHPRKKMKKQNSKTLRWQSLNDHIPKPHRSGKTVVCGHSAQREGNILDLGYLVCIDTFIYGGGYLTALDVGSGDFWQANQDGKLE